VSGEGVTRVAVARPFIAFALGPAGIVAGITTALGGMRFARVSGSAAEVPPVIVPIPREPGRSAPLVVSFVVAIRAAAVARWGTVFVA
jgi:hypothetical protein